MKVTTLRANILRVRSRCTKKYEQARCSWKQQIYVTFEIIGACKVQVEHHIDIAISYQKSSYSHDFFCLFFQWWTTKIKLRSRRGILSTKKAFKMGFKERFCKCQKHMYVLIQQAHVFDIYTIEAQLKFTHKPKQNTMITNVEIKHITISRMMAIFLQIYTTSHGKLSATHWPKATHV